jgi:hypothetical protein
MTGSSPGLRCGFCSLIGPLVLRRDTRIKAGRRQRPVPEDD